MVTPIEFPLYLLPKKQVQTYVRIDWPVVEEVVDIFTGIPYKHYDHQQIMDLYNSRASERFLCSGGAGCLGKLFTDRLCPALQDGSSSKHRVLVAT
ncbi:MAG: hypothetical protein KAW46_10070, partial [candidate division Zixibacteria bacterium]|nr:hypothetical protein [candidate division Zixibacteria bacterium]